MFFFDRALLKSFDFFFVLDVCSHVHTHFIFDANRPVHFPSH